MPCGVSCWVTVKPCFTAVVSLKIGYIDDCFAKISKTKQRRHLFVNPIVIKPTEIGTKWGNERVRHVRYLVRCLFDILSHADAEYTEFSIKYTESHSQN